MENAFKHGKVNDASNPLLIKIKTNNKTFIFSIKNKKSNGLKEKSSGIGLSNVKNRLALGYPDLHLLEITENSEYYSVNLTINQ